MTEGVYQSFFLVSDEGVIVVDCPPDLGVRVKYAIGNLTDAPIRALVYSHAHADHIQGAFLLVEPGVEIIAHKETARMLRDMNDPNRPVPTRVFRRRKHVRVGNQTLELEYRGDNHQAGNIFIWAPAQKVIMLVDVIFSGWAPFTELGVASSVPGFIRAHDEVLAYDFDYFLGGHLTRPGTRREVELAREYVLDLKDTCKAILQDPSLFGPAIGNALVANPGNLWASGEVIFDATAPLCAERVTPRWLGRLAAVDVFAQENAFRMIASLRVDYGFLPSPPVTV